MSNTLKKCDKNILLLINSFLDHKSSSNLSCINKFCNKHITTKIIQDKKEYEKNINIIKNFLRQKFVYPYIIFRQFVKLINNNPSELNKYFRIHNTPRPHLCFTSDNSTLSKSFSTFSKKFMLTHIKKYSHFDEKIVSLVENLLN
tara:strand:- start:8 stop:442 length:435 start_codon:yes stop_codon:yes gene_type:complete